MKTNAMKIYFLQLTVWTVRHTLEGEEKKMKIKRKINKFLGLLISCYQCCFFITTNYILVWMFSPVFLWAASHSSSSRGFGGSACAHSCPLLWQTHSSVAPLNKSSPADVQRGKSASCRQHLTLSQHLYKTRFIQKYAFKNSYSFRYVGHFWGMTGLYLPAVQAGVLQGTEGISKLLLLGLWYHGHWGVQHRLGSMRTLSWGRCLGSWAAHAGKS